MQLAVSVVLYLVGEVSDRQGLWGPGVLAYSVPPTGAGYESLLGHEKFLSFTPMTSAFLCMY